MTGERTRLERLLHKTVAASVLSRHLSHRHLHTHIFAYTNSCVNKWWIVERTQFKLLVSLLYDRRLARLGLGARAVAPNSAAHACRVALTWLAQLRASPQGWERLKRGLLCSK